MSKLLFVPFRLVGGLIAGALSKKAFAGIWRLIDDKQAPEPEHREVSWNKLIAALLLEGAIFRAVRGIFDHGSRVAYSRVIGKWPGAERTDTA